MWAIFETKAQKQLYMTFVWKFFLDFLITANQANPYLLLTNWLGLLESVNLKSEENLLKTSCKIAPVIKIAHIF